MPIIPPSSVSAPGTVEHGRGAPAGTGHERDAALQQAPAASAMPAPLLTFEGLSNAENRFMRRGRIGSTGGCVR